VISVASWYTFKTKIPIGVNFGLEMEDFGIFYGHCVYFTAK
jgi:hypothetical protein